ncbi:MAG: hypothetical protein K0R46_724 [Herbinix sp.]|jgi:hypothetical protein|nr:hypothetical protein [Herbinix sp.]
MAYQVHRITAVEQLKACDVFQIDQYQWTEGNKPKAYGQMALLADYGLVISMSAVERDPLRTYTVDDDPVYRDSALEAFLNFAPNQSVQRYLNFEMNANGALLSQFGTSTSRKSLSSLTAIKASCEAMIEPDSWEVLLKIPMELICSMYEIKPLQQGDSFTCNFYKICEASGLEHFASHAPINSDIPNFHLPEFFTQAIIVD